MARVSNYSLNQFYQMDMGRSFSGSGAYAKFFAGSTIDSVAMALRSATAFSTLEPRNVPTYNKHHYYTEAFKEWVAKYAAKADDMAMRRSLINNHVAYWKVNHGLDISKQVLFMDTYGEVVAPHYSSYLAQARVAAMDTGITHNRRFIDTNYHQFHLPLRAINTLLYAGDKARGAFFDDKSKTIEDDERERLLLGYKRMGQFLLTLPSVTEDMFLQYGLPSYVGVGGPDDMEVIIEEFRDTYQTNLRSLTA